MYNPAIPPLPPPPDALADSPLPPAPTPTVSVTTAQVMKFLDVTLPAASPRKMRLLLLAVFQFAQVQRPEWKRIDSDIQDAGEMVTKLADSTPSCCLSSSERERAREMERENWEMVQTANPEFPAFCQTCSLTINIALGSRIRQRGVRQALRIQCQGDPLEPLNDKNRGIGPQSVMALLHEIFGNPAKPVARDPSWLTSTVAALAGGIYAENGFDRLPILADALMDAGCDDAELLTHCRSDGPHVRGCWAVDLLLGKS